MVTLSGTTPMGFRGTQIRDTTSGTLLAVHRQRMTVTAGPDKGLAREIEGTHIIVGTAPQADVTLSDPTVSRFHCEFFVKGDRFHVRDLESTNGTRVDETPVVEAIVSPGARVRIGSTEILFRPHTDWERVESSQSEQFGQLSGRSANMQAVFSLLKQIAPTELSCILMGETGTGKELAARAIHAASPRRDHPFVVLDCGALSESLVESELFGHEKGAFTGADARRIGAFEQAHGGVVFLDELGEIPLALQPKLLRALERREIKRLGASQPIFVDVRILAATHRDLDTMITNRQFRDDLYYRLAEVVVELPPLRERREDIRVIATAILNEHIARGGKISRIDDAAMRALEARSWPGNVRELRNTLHRAFALAPQDILRVSDLGLGAERATNPPRQGATEVALGSVQENPATRDRPASGVSDGLNLKDARDRWLEGFETRYLEGVLEACGGDIDEAAKRAGIHKKSFERLLRRRGIRRFENNDDSSGDE